MLLWSIRSGTRHSYLRSAVAQPANLLEHLVGMLRARGVDMRLSRYLFLLVSACQTSGSQLDAGACGTYDLGPPVLGRSSAAGSASTQDCSSLCSVHGCPTGFCTLELDTKGDQILTCSQDHTGRRPRGLVAPRARDHSPRCPVGAYFASVAHLESASVPAFQLVARELAAFGAPRSLQRAAQRSAREEIRHARMMTALAVRHGARVPPLRLRPVAARSLETFARENAVEGCVKETYGAAFALHQAARAADRELRVAMTVIARDELRHAELAWKIDAWARSQLSSRAASRVAEARRRAAGLLVARERRAADSSLGYLLGFPTRKARIALATAVGDAAWNKPTAS
jgi:hypothetical protein